MLKELNHVTVRTDDLEATRAFYEDVLGLPVGSRPPLAFPGYWHYCGDRPVVHLVPSSAGIGGGAGDETGAFDHVAFLAEDYEGMRANLVARGLLIREQDIPAARLRQLFLRDPNGVVIELNFRAV